MCVCFNFKSSFVNKNIICLNIMYLQNKRKIKVWKSIEYILKPSAFTWGLSPEVLPFLHGCRHMQWLLRHMPFLWLLGRSSIISGGHCMLAASKSQERRPDSAHLVQPRSRRHYNCSHVEGKKTKHHQWGDEKKRKRKKKADFCALEKPSHSTT